MKILFLILFLIGLLFLIALAIKALIFNPWFWCAMILLVTGSWGFFSED